MIVFDTSSLVGALLKAGSVPEHALLIALASDKIALSDVVFAEIDEVFRRPRFAKAGRAGRADWIMQLIMKSAVWFDPQQRLAACRDPDDDKYLELALAAAAGTIVSSDDGLLVLNPWRGVHVLRPAQYLRVYEQG